MKNYKNIGGVTNQYGGVVVAESDGKYFWTIEDYYGTYNDDFEEIPKSLYDELLAFEESRS